MNRELPRSAALSSRPSAARQAARSDPCQRGRPRSGVGEFEIEVGQRAGQGQRRAERPAPLELGAARPHPVAIDQQEQCRIEVDQVAEAVGEQGQSKEAAVRARPFHARLDVSAALGAKRRIADQRMAEREQARQFIALADPGEDSGARGLGAIGEAGAPGPGVRAAVDIVVAAGEA